MAIDRFLAAVPAEIRENRSLIPRLAYMGCHFSPSGPGLSNCPKSLPRGSLLLLDDLTPIQGHDPQLAAAQLREVVAALACSALLLDFQRPVTQEAQNMALALLSSCPCPTALTAPYARELDCPVCLPPIPCHTPLDACLAPWKGREIWLEVSIGAEEITLTPEGPRESPLAEIPTGTAHRDAGLHCHYTIRLSEDSAIFSLWRSAEDLADLEQQAEGLGVTKTLGLWQELGDFPGST